MDLSGVLVRQLNNFELISTAIGEKPYACKSLRVLNLSQNQLTKEHAKILAQDLETNKTIEVLDLSHNNFGVYGTILIAGALEKNTSVKKLNMFKNNFDVDGARAIGKLLKANSNIEWLDIGHNRIRQKGLEAIQEGLIKGKNLKLKSLGIRMNFINDDGLAAFFEKVVLTGAVSLKNLYLADNNFTEYKSKEVHKQLTDKKIGLFVDRFEKISYTSDSKMEKTLFVQLGSYQSLTANSIKNCNALATQLRSKKSGLVKPPVRVRFGRKIWNKKSQVNAYMFVEFEDLLSIANVTSLNSRGILLGAFKTNIAGSNTFVHIRRSQRK